MWDRAALFVRISSDVTAVHQVLGDDVLRRGYKSQSVVLVSTSLFAYGLAGSVAHSQASAPNILPPITVEGDQIASAVKTALEARHAAPNSTVIIEGEQLNQFNDLSVGDAIRRLPGVTFPGVNRSREIKLRGLPGVYTRVLLDGRPLIDGDSGRNMEVDRIPASFIERVEIIRSPVAGMDSQGAAGTINIITKRTFGASGNGGGLTLGGGHVEGYKETGEASAWQGGKVGPLKYFIGGGYQRRLLEESINTYNVFGYTGSGGSNLQSQKRSFDEYTALSRFEYAHNESNTFIFSPTYMRTEETRTQSDSRYQATAPLYLNRATNEIRNRNRENVGGYFEWAHSFSNTASGRLFFDMQKASETTVRNSTQYTYNAAGAITGTTYPNVNNYVPIDLRRYAPGAAFNTALGAHNIEAGAGLNRLTRREFDRGSTTRNYKISEDIFYGYLSDSFAVLGRDKLTAGVRVERSSTDAMNNVGLTRNSSATDVNPSVNYRAPLAENIDFRAGVAKTMRRPDLRDLSPVTTLNGGTYTNPDTRGNADLLPERIWGGDVGADWYLFDRAGLLSFNLFRRQFQDKIETNTVLEGARYVSAPRNAGKGTLDGAEFEARVPLKMLNAPELTLWGNATVLGSELTDPLTQQTRRFSEQPNLLTNVGLDYYHKPWNTTFGINYNRVYGYSQNIASLSGGTPAVSVLTYTQTEFNALDRIDFSIRTVVSPNITISFSALNLLRPIDRRTITTANAAGVVSTRQITEQASHSTYYLRTTFTW